MALNKLKPADSVGNFNHVVFLWLTFNNRVWLYSQPVDNIYELFVQKEMDISL